MAVSELNGGCHGSGPFVLLDKRLKRGKEEAMLSMLSCSLSCQQLYIRNGSWMPISNMDIGGDLPREVSLHSRKKHIFVSFMKSGVLMGA